MDTPASPMQLRGQILDILCETYAPEFAGKGWYDVKHAAKPTFASDLCLELTTLIFAEIVWVELDHGNEARNHYYRRTLDRSIMQVIWNNFPGGTTAEAVARDICELLNIKADN